MRKRNLVALPQAPCDTAVNVAAAERPATGSLGRHHPAQERGLAPDHPAGAAAQAAAHDRGRYFRQA